MRKVLLIVAIACLPLAAWDGFSSSGYARGAAAYLDRPGHAYASALGGAVTACNEGLAGIQYNPAILDFSETMTLSASYWFLSDDRKFIAMDAAAPIGQYCVAGVSFRRFSVGEIERRDEYGFQDGVFDDKEDAFAVAVAGRLFWNISVGVRGRYLNQQFTDIDKASAHGMGFDAGAVWHADSHLCIGVSGLNMGSYMFWATGQRDIVLPQARFGIGGLLFDGRLRLEADAVKTLKQPIDALAGVQYTLFDIISLRSGIASSIDIR